MREGQEDRRMVFQAPLRARTPARDGVEVSPVIRRCKGCGAPLVNDEPGLGLCYGCLWHILGPGYCPDCD